MDLWKKLFIVSIIFCPFFFLSTVSAGMQMPKQLQCNLINKSTKNRECLYRVTKGQGHATVYATTNMPYALCSKSLCTLKNAKARFASCVCAVFGTQRSDWKNASVSPKRFNQSRPIRRNKKLIAVTSNFSMANVNKKPAKKIVCNTNKAFLWANCFGVRCEVHYRTRRGAKIPFALCRCPVMKTKRYTSLGITGKKFCKPPKNRVWSAATNQQRNNNVGVMLDMYKRYYSKTALN